MQRGGWIDPRLKATKLDTIAAHWLNANPGKRAGSLARDESILGNHVLPVLEVTRPSVRSQEATFNDSSTNGPHGTHRRLCSG